MMVPLMLPEAPPTDFQLKMKPTLLAIVSLQSGTALCRILVGDIWGGLSDVMVAVIGGYAVAETSVTYTLYYGVGCALNCFFDIAGLCMRFARFKAGYFDLDRPFLYNLASFSLLAATMAALLGALVCFFIWRDFKQCAGELAPIAPFYGAPAASFGSFAPPPAPGSAQTLPNQALSTSGSFDAFSGPGYRLHDPRPPSIDNLPPAPRMSYS
mmetsp:Transcript_48572/g.140739  ORF Transcript_48572/g.140739 Transcript_48572/m.140739 type:complete len:212 (+) Transcript_48572:73-708(+)